MDTPPTTSVDVTLDLGEAGCGQLVMEIKVAMVVANAAVASGKNTMVFLSSEGVRLAVKGVADNIHEEGLQPMAKLIKNFRAAGGTLWVCSPCFKKRGYTDGDLIEGATIVGGAKLVEFLSDDGTGVSY